MPTNFTWPAGESKIFDFIDSFIMIQQIDDQERWYNVGIKILLSLSCTKQAIKKLTKKQFSFITEIILSPAYSKKASTHSIRIIIEKSHNY